MKNILVSKIISFRQQDRDNHQYKSNRQLSYKRPLPKVNNSCSPFNKTKRESPEKLLVSSKKVKQPRNKEINPFIEIEKIFSENKNLNSQEEVLADIARRFDQCISLSSQHESGIQKVLLSVQKFMGQSFLKFIHYQKIKMENSVKTIIRMADYYEKEIQNAKLQKDLEMKRKVFEVQYELGKKIDELIGKNIFNTELFYQLELLGKINLDSWARNCPLMERCILINNENQFFQKKSSTYRSRDDDDFEESTEPKKPSIRNFSALLPPPPVLKKEVQCQFCSQMKSQ